jgi:hypothetical protein
MRMTVVIAPDYPRSTIVPRGLQTIRRILRYGNAAERHCGVGVALAAQREKADYQD